MNELLELYQSYWKKFANFDGYETQRSYWLTVLCCFVVSLVIGIIGRIPFIGWIVTVLYGIASIIPGLSLTARRLRDAGYTPLWMLLYLVPCIGWIAVLVMCCMPSKNSSTYY